MPTLTIHINVPFCLEQEDDVIVASCPMIDVASQGNTEEEAKKNLSEAIGLFFVTCIEMGTFSDVLKQCGFSPAQHPVSDNDFDHIDVPLPFIAAKSLAECHA